MLAVVFLTCSCAQSVNLRVDAPHTKVLVNGTDIGVVPPEGATLDVKPGMAPLDVEIVDGDKSTIGHIARSEPVWWLIAAGVGGALCCGPTLASAGICIANPAVLGAPLVLLTGDVGALTSTCVAPSWFTLPVVTSCGAVGMAPLGLAFIAEAPPSKILIHKGALGPESGGHPETAEGAREMPW